jgi:hypothetical protein
MRHRHTATVLLAAFALSTAAFAADKGLPAPQVIAAMQAAVAAHPGNVKEVEVDDKRKGTVVKVKIVDAQGTKHNVRVDAQTNQVMK